MNERIAKLEAILPTLATGKDVEALRADMHKGFTDSTRWTFGIVLAIVGIAVTIMIFAINRAMPPASQPPQPQPIVIQLPPAASVPLPPETKK